MLHTVLLSLALVACDGGTPEGSKVADQPGRERTLTLAAYTTPREAYGQAILPAFAKHWKEKTGETVKFEESYQGSGAQARAVVGGFEADVVALSLDPDVKTIADAGLITHDWHAGPAGGMVTRSVVVLAVRAGNPKNIHDWADLVRPEVEVLTPNVRTSGGAMWNIAAAYGAAIRGKAGATAGDELAAEDRVAGVLRQVKVMDKGARESILSFEKGVGDVAITYENEAIVSKAGGQPIEYVVPASTLRIDNPIAVVDKYATAHGNEDLARAFVEFVLTPEAQLAFTRFGLRPAVEVAGAPALPQPADLFTVTDLGGWQTVQDKLFKADALYDRALKKSKP
jgi:sulfate/thiosulfate-binding protein